MTEQKIILKNTEINYKHFSVSPKDSSKGVFLILHGWGGSSESWMKVCQCLESNYEIYAIDFPFFGKSGNLKEVWGVDDYVALVEEFAEKAIWLNFLKPHPTLRLSRKSGQAPPSEGKGTKKINIISHSFGGRVAIKLAAKNHLWLDKLYLCSAAGIRHPLTLKQRMGKSIAATGKKFFGGNLNGTKKYFYKFLGASDYYNCKNEEMRKTFQNVIEEDLTPYLNKIKTPTTIIWGDKDKYTPLEDGYLMNREIKKSDLHILKGIGHGVHLRAPEKICGIIKNISGIA